MFKASNDLSFSLSPAPLQKSGLPFSKLLLPLVPPLLQPTPSDHGASDNTLNPVCRLPELVRNGRSSRRVSNGRERWRSTKERELKKKRRSRGGFLVFQWYIRSWEATRRSLAGDKVRSDRVLRSNGKGDTRPCCRTWFAPPRSVLHEGCSTECRESTRWQIVRNE